MDKWTINHMKYLAQTLAPKVGEAFIAVFCAYLVYNMMQSEDADCPISFGL